jgi:hypothetical protein
MIALGGNHLVTLWPVDFWNVQKNNIASWMDDVFSPTDVK